MQEKPDLAEANLPALFPDASPEQLDRIRLAASRVHPALWNWNEENVARVSGPETVHCSLMSSTRLGEDADDQIDLELGVSRRAAGVVVDATVSVWCWCPQNHNVHYVRDVETTSTNAEELTAAFESAVDQIVQWRDTLPHDAERLRAEAGLPLRRG